MTTFKEKMHILELEKYQGLTREGFLVEREQKADELKELWEELMRLTTHYQSVPIDEKINLENQINEIANKYASIVL